MTAGRRGCGTTGYPGAAFGARTYQRFRATCGGAGGLAFALLTPLSRLPDLFDRPLLAPLRLR